MFTVVESAMLDIMKLLEGKTASVNRTNFCNPVGLLKNLQVTAENKSLPLTLGLHQQQMIASCVFHD